MRFCLLGLTLVLALTTGCARKPEAALPGGSGPAFDPIAFFNGHTHSWGVIEARSGQPGQWVVTDSEGQVDVDGLLRMVQHLSFQDGSKQRRDWILRRVGTDKYNATANDMVGTAKGQSDGRIFHWQWVLARSPGNGLMNVTMNQWMYHMEDGTVTIRTTISKLGIIVAEVTEQFVRAGKQMAAAE